MRANWCCHRLSPKDSFAFIVSEYMHWVGSACLSVCSWDLSRELSELCLNLAGCQPSDKTALFYVCKEVPRIGRRFFFSLFPNGITNSHGPVFNNLEVWGNNFLCLLGKLATTIIKSSADVASYLSW